MEKRNELIPVGTAETTDTLLRQIHDSIMEQNRQTRRQVRLLRICLIAIALIALVAVLCAVSVLPALNQTLSDIDAAVNAIDMQQIDALLKNGSGAIAAMNNALVQINGLDFEALNTTIRGLESTVGSLSEIDIDLLNAAIKNLNDTVEPFANFFKKMK